MDTLQITDHKSNVFNNTHEMVHIKETHTTLIGEIEKILQLHPAYIMALQANAQLVSDRGNPDNITLFKVAHQIINTLTKNDPSLKSRMDECQRITDLIITDDESANAVRTELIQIYKHQSSISIRLDQVFAVVSLIRAFSSSQHIYPNNQLYNKEVVDIIQNHLKNCKASREEGRAEPPITFNAQDILKKCKLEWTGYFGGWNVKKGSDALEGSDKIIRDSEHNMQVMNTLKAAATYQHHSEFSHEFMRETKSQIDTHLELSEAQIEIARELVNGLNAEDIDKDTLKDYSTDLLGQVEETQNFLTEIKAKTQEKLSTSQKTIQSVETFVKENILVTAPQGYPVKRQALDGMFGGNKENSLRIANTTNSKENSLRIANTTYSNV